MVGKPLKMLAIPMAKHRITHRMPVLSGRQPPVSPICAARLESRGNRRCALLELIRSPHAAKELYCACVYRDASEAASQGRLGPARERPREERLSRKSRVALTIVRIYL